jgi:hypothetical protein
MQKVIQLQTKNAAVLTADRQPASISSERSSADRMGDDEELLDYARRYFLAAAQSTERRKMQILVKLGLEYLKLAAQAERTRLRQRRATLRKPDRAPHASGRSNAAD